MIVRWNMSSVRVYKAYARYVTANLAHLSFQLLHAEQQRDQEFARLTARHVRDKQIISALKLKIERQALEIHRAEGVPEHEAEHYLDLLQGDSSGVLSPSKSLSPLRTGAVREAGAWVTRLPHLPPFFCAFR